MKLDSANKGPTETSGQLAVVEQVLPFQDGSKPEAIHSKEPIEVSYIVSAG